MFLQCKECFIKCTCSVTVCSLKDGPLSSYLILVVYVDALLQLLAYVFTRYVQSRLHTLLFIQGLNLYPLEIMATAQNVAYQDEV